jgi:hypothetical protein
MKNFQTRIALYNLLAISFLGISGYILVVDTDWAATGRGGMAFLISAFCAVFGNLDRLESFKASAQGIEGKTREVIQKADVTIDLLQKISMRNAKIFISLMQSSSRWGGMSEKEKTAIKEDLLNDLREIKLSKEDIEKVRHADKKWIVYDYYTGMMDFLYLYSQEKLSGNVVNEFTGRRMNDYIEDYANLVEPIKPSEIKEFVTSKLDYVPRFLEKTLVSYDHYYKTGKHVDLKLWEDMENWRDMAIQDAKEEAERRNA